MKMLDGWSMVSLDMSDGQPKEKRIKTALMAKLALTIHFGLEKIFFSTRDELVMIRRRVNNST